MQVALAGYKAHKGGFMHYLKTVKPSNKHTDTGSLLAGIVPIATPLRPGRGQLVDPDCVDKKAVGDFEGDQTKRCPMVQH